MHFGLLFQKEKIYALRNTYSVLGKPSSTIEPGLVRLALSAPGRSAGSSP